MGINLTIKFQFSFKQLLTSLWETSFDASTRPFKITAVNWTLAVGRLQEPRLWLATLSLSDGQFHPARSCCDGQLTGLWELFGQRQLVQWLDFFWSQRMNQQFRWRRFFDFWRKGSDTSIVFLQFEYGMGADRLQSLKRQLQINNAPLHDKKMMRKSCFRHCKTYQHLHWKTF